jgi:uncharacterized protein YqgC (DUF456 family)
VAGHYELLGVLVALEFVVLSAVLLLVAPLEAVAPVVPLAVVFLLALLAYRYGSDQ